MFKKEFLSIGTIIKTLTIMMIVFFFSGIFFFIMTPQKAGFGVLELIITIWVLWITIIYYQKYSNKILLQRLKINLKTKIV